MRQNTFGDNAMRFASILSKIRTVKFAYEPDACEPALLSAAPACRSHHCFWVQRACSG